MYATVLETPVVASVATAMAMDDAQGAEAQEYSIESDQASILQIIVSHEIHQCYLLM